MSIYFQMMALVGWHIVKLTEEFIVSNGNGFLKFFNITVDSLNSMQNEIYLRKSNVIFNKIALKSYNESM